MMTVNFIAVGKLKEAYFREACAEYRKRLCSYAGVTVSEPDPAELPREPGRALIVKALDREAELIRARIKGGFKIAMCVEGKTMTSTELAAKLGELANGGISTVNFVVGSSFGLAEGFKRECDLCLSMSPMTFPHGLARVMLFEQVYRAFSILNNSKYHK